MRAETVLCVAAAGMALAFGSAATAVDIETVPVGDPGNAPDDRYAIPGWGAVGYAYRIGKYEVTNAQCAEFLNAVAAVGDPYGLYNPNMGGGGWNDIGGISRTGSGTGGDPWVYSTRPSRGDRPVILVSFWDACRFANWLHNGQPTGAQGPGTTETGAYTLDGYTGDDGRTISRNASWQWAVTSQDEWYKAAYYKGGGTNAGYWDYPTGSDTAPTAEVPPGTNMTDGSANHYWGVGDLTDVGAYAAKPSSSPYGTFDQGGNVWEVNDTIIWSFYRGWRGGSFQTAGGGLRARNQSLLEPARETMLGGFRVVEVPEPTGLAILALGGLALIRRRR